VAHDRLANCREDELITRSAPQWAWDVIDETLAMDAQSSAFDPELRDEIDAALAAMTD
jgi:hypothetical protein